MIRLDVIGVPQPKGSMTRMPGGAMIPAGTTKSRAANKAWADAVADAARRYIEANPMSPLAEPVAVRLAFRFATVASDPYRTLHVGTPDVDKLVRLVFDSMKAGGLLADDRYVWKVYAEKRYCAEHESPGCTIEVSRWGATENLCRNRLKHLAIEARKAARAAAKATA